MLKNKTKMIQKRKCENPEENTEEPSDIDQSNDIPEELSYEEKLINTLRK